MFCKNIALLAAAVFCGAFQALSTPATNAVANLAACGAASQPSHWTNAVAAGATLTRGNSRTFLATAKIDSGGTWGNNNRNQLLSGADGTYGRAAVNNVSTENADQLHGFLQYNRLFTERLYALARTEALHDGIADIQYRLNLDPGAGYYVIKNKKMDLSLESGAGYQMEELDDESHDFATLRAGEKAHLELSDRARAWQAVECVPQVDELDNYTVNFEIGIEADLCQSKKFTLRSYLDDAYNNHPAPDRLKNDMKLVTAVAYKF